MAINFVACIGQAAQRGHELLQAFPRLSARALCLAVFCLAAGVVVARAQLSVDHADLVVARPVMNIFLKASAESEVVSQALYGSGVSELKRENGWVRIRTADGYEGWAQTGDLREIKGEAYAPAEKLYLVESLTANIYREPDVTQQAAVLQAPWESRLEAAPGDAKENERWMRVRLVDGSLGWVQRGDVRKPQPAISIAETIKLAQRFLGVTYTWGGVSSFGYDCSGYTQMLMRQRGVLMPRDAIVQAAWSGVAPVERKDLAPGDLLYFGSKPDHITHTGMYIGDGQFIHATPHGRPGVQIGTLNDEPWNHLFVAARRAKP